MSPCNLFCSSWNDNLFIRNLTSTWLYWLSTVPMEILCRFFQSEHATTPDSWFVQNERINALLRKLSYTDHWFLLCSRCRHSLFLDFILSQFSTVLDWTLFRISTDSMSDARHFNYERFTEYWLDKETGKRVGGYAQWKSQNWVNYWKLV